MKLGQAFSDNVLEFRRRRATPAPPRLRGWGGRITLLKLVLLASLFLLSVRLFHLTVVQGSENRNLSQENRVREAVIHAPRGIFRDRFGKPLVENIANVRATEFCEKGACPTKRFLESEWEKIPDKNHYSVEHDFFRQYLYPYETAHILGYLGEISEDEMANPYYTYQGYNVGDRLGRMGLEEVFEKKIRGIDGKELIEVDSNGAVIRTLGKIDPVPGNDMTLSIDLELQKAAFTAMGEQPGVVIVSKPKTGEILALVSTPSFDPNKIHRGISPKEYALLTESEDQPLFNKAISGVYPPGSTFKIVAAVGALEEKAVTAQTLVEDTGILRIGEFSFGNWYFLQHGGTDGNVDIIKALARSNDIYFYRLGEAIGITKLAQWGKRLGLGSKTGIELSGEAEGVMPDPSWRKKVRDAEWYLGDTYHIAIGQGDLQTTPLQVNLWTNIIASGGKKCRPTLIKISDDKQQIADNCEDLQLKEETVKLVTEGMRRACYQGNDVEYQGTGWPLFHFSVTKETLTSEGGESQTFAVPVACKTGTAEVGDAAENAHAWFTAFAPLPDQYVRSTGDATVITGEPEIVVTVLVEKGGEGSTVAAPIAKKILETWFTR